MSIEAKVFLGFIAFLIAFYVPPVLYFKFGWFSKWFHNVLKWHQPDNSPHGYDGCSIHAKCKWCGEDIMQDSQGNWF